MRGVLAPLLEDTCSHETIRRRGLIDPDLVAPARAASRSDLPGSCYPKMWTLMILELWCRSVLDTHPQPATENCVAGV